MNQNDLEWFAARLSIAVYDVQRLTPEMSTFELKAAFKGIEGSEYLTVSYAPNGNQLIHIGDKTLEVGPMASNDEIATALQNPFIRTENTVLTMNPIDRLKEKMAQAAGAGGRVAAKLEAKADSLIAREAQLDAKADGAFALHEATLDSAGAVIDHVESAVNILTNGGPPLEDPK